MLKRDLVRVVGTMLLGGVAMLAVLPACDGANAGETTPVSVKPQPTATSQPIVTAAATATIALALPTATVATVLPTATIAPVLTTAPTVPSNSDLVAKGKLIFEKTAGGVGCAFCHGLDGRGKGPAGLPAANIRGKNEGDVRAAIQGGVPMMGFIKLNDDEITAVAAYLQYLIDQP